MYLRGKPPAFACAQVVHGRTGPDLRGQHQIDGNSMGHTLTIRQTNDIRQARNQLWIGQISGINQIAAQRLGAHAFSRDLDQLNLIKPASGTVFVMGFHPFCQQLLTRGKMRDPVQTRANARPHGMRG